MTLPGARLYEAETPLPPAPCRLAAVDTETTRFREPKYDTRRKTRHEPPDIPELVLGSIAVDGRVYVLHRKELCEAIQSLVSDGYELVFHNAAFDYHVLNRYSVGLGRSLREHISQNKVHDTQILEQLIQIARGSQTVDQKTVKYVSLKDVAKRRLGMDLSKDHDVRVGFEAFLDPGADIPYGHLKYAADDAIATYGVFCNQWKEALLYAAGPCRYPVLADARRLFGLLTEAVQVKGSIALAWLEQFPLRVDLPAVERLRDKFHKESAVLQDALVAYKYARRAPKSGKFSLSHVTLRKLLTEYGRERNLDVPYSTGSHGKPPVLSLTYDFWSQVLPHMAEGGESQHLCKLEGTDDRLSVWLRYCRLRKLLSTYLEPYGTSPVHYPSYHNLGARTGRTSCVRPNVTNIPKRKDGIRALFIPQSGRVLLEGDYKAAELISLAQVYKLLYGGSFLGDSINAGEDPHESSGRRLVGDEAYTKDPKKYRQLAKAANFGLPGGLGAKKFRVYAGKAPYNVKMTEDEAKEMRYLALDADPALRRYLSDSYSPASTLKLAARNLGIPFDALISGLKAWRRDGEEPHWDLAMSRLKKWVKGDNRFEIPEPPGFRRDWDLFRTTTCTPTGRIRGRASYTEAHNSPFQGLVADGAKLAAWNLYNEHCDGGTWWSPVAFVHDSFVVECAPELYDQASHLLRKCMVAGLSAVCPDMRVEVDLTKPLERWGSNTDAQGKEV